MLIVLGLVAVYVYLKETVNISDFLLCVDAFIFTAFLVSLAGILMYLFYLIFPAYTPMFDPSVTGVYVAPYYTMGRLCGLFKDPNAYAFSLLPLLGLSISSYFVPTSCDPKPPFLRRKGFLLIVVILLLINLLLTLSRGGYVGFMVLLFVLGLLIFPKKSISLAVKVLMILSLIACSVALFHSFVADVIGLLRQLLFEKRMSFEESRVALWLAGIRVFILNPFWGIGQGLVRERVFMQIGREMQIHNTYIELFAENGLFVGLCFLSLLILLVRKSLYFLRRIPNRDVFYYYFSGIFSSFVGMLASMMSISVFTLINFWFQVGLLLICMNLSKYRMR